MPEYKCVTMWECEWKAFESTLSDSDFTFVKPNPEPLNPRAAFYGGRTNANCLYYECKEGEKIRYVDFTSLYPSINKYGSYPIGHPEVITSQLGDISEYYGLVRCKVLPPQNFIHPVLPIKINGKLMFPLC